MRGRRGQFPHICISFKDQPEPGNSEAHAGNSGDGITFRQNFFQEDMDCNSSNPENIHHTQHKQQRHQRPAAANAIETVLHAELDRRPRPLLESAMRLDEGNR